MMTDLHCHILHHIDDGPSELDESVELCRIAQSNNIEQIVLTPHITDLSEVDDFLSKRDRRIEELKKALHLIDVKIDLFAGAEVFVSDEIFYTNCLNRLTINQSRYILVEFSFSGLSLTTLRRYIAEIQNYGLIPIIAHPERYEYFQRNYEMINIILQDGALFQVNASSLCREGSKAEYRLAKELVSKKVASFLATDAHSVDYRPNNLLDMLFSVPSEVNSDYFEDMVNRNPDMVLQNNNVEAYQMERIKKRWGSLFK